MYMFTWKCNNCNERVTIAKHIGDEKDICPKCGKEKEVVPYNGGGCDFYVKPGSLYSLDRIDIKEAEKKGYEPISVDKMRKNAEDARNRIALQKKKQLTTHLESAMRDIRSGRKFTRELRQQRGNT